MVTKSTLLQKIQIDLFSYTEKDPDDFAGMAEFWYLANSEALSAALSNRDGLNLIINVRSFQKFESLCKRLFLLADTLILRDPRNWNTDFTETRAIPIPTQSYRPSYLDDCADDLLKLRPSPFTRIYDPRRYWTSDKKTLKDGTEIAYAIAGGYHSLPSDLLDWISGPGKSYLQTGQVICAPFIPPIEDELELLKHNINLSETFSAQSLFHQKNDFLSEDHLQALISLDLPFIDGIDISTISRIKQDHHDEFTLFSRNIIDALNSLKSSYGSEGFVSEVRHIQRNHIDASLSDVNRAFNRIKKSRALRKGGIFFGLAGLNAATLVGLLPAPLVTGLSASMGALLAERATRLKEEGEIREKKGYFLWKIRELSDQKQA